MAKGKAKAWAKKQGVGGFAGMAQDMDVLAADAIQIGFGTDPSGNGYADKWGEVAKRYSGYDMEKHEWNFDNAKPTWAGIATRMVDRVISAKTGHYRAMSRGSWLANGAEVLNLYEEFGPAFRGQQTFADSNACYVASLSAYNPKARVWSLGDPHFFRRMVTVHGLSDVGRFVISHWKPANRAARKIKGFFNQ